MICTLVWYEFNNILCELINVLLIGIIVAIIASLIYALLVNKIRNCKNKKTFKYLMSKNKNDYDWTCYSMKEENGRIRNDNHNGSIVNIKHLKGNILSVKLKQLLPETKSTQLSVSCST